LTLGVGDFRINGALRAGGHDGGTDQLLIAEDWQPPTLPRGRSQVKQWVVPPPERSLLNSRLAALIGIFEAQSCPSHLGFGGRAPTFLRQHHGKLGQAFPELLLSRWSRFVVLLCGSCSTGLERPLARCLSATIGGVSLSDGDAAGSAEHLQLWCLPLETGVPVNQV